MACQWDPSGGLKALSSDMGYIRNMTNINNITKMGVCHKYSTDNRRCVYIYIYIYVYIYTYDISLVILDRI